MRWLIETELGADDLEALLPAGARLDRASRVPMGTAAVWTVESDEPLEQLEGRPGVVAVWPSSEMNAYGPSGS